jgi:hypothetical protein
MQIADLHAGVRYPSGRMIDRRVALWRRPGGKSFERIFGALVLDELCSQAAKPTADLLRELRSRLKRQLSRQTLAAWRRGDQAIPVEILFAVAFLARGSIADAALKVAMDVLQDEAADPDIAAAVRRYYDRGRRAGMTPG